MEEPKLKKIDIHSKDRISLLPEQTLHLILSSLSQKEAIRTCVLSKAWRYLGCTRPIIDFQGTDKIYSPAVLDTILQGYHDQNLRLDKFNLWLSKSYVDHVESELNTASLLNKWIPMIIQDMRVQIFCLGLNEGLQLVFEVPWLIFRSHHIRALCLQRCVLRRTTKQLKPDLKLLQTLTLTRVYIPEQILDSILSGCHFLKRVFLLDCDGFTRIKLLKNNNNKHNNKPTKLQLFNFRDVADRGVVVEIGDDMQALKTIEIDRCLFSVSREKPLEFARLTRLSLTRVKLSSSSSGLFSCNLHCLEELKLDQCSGIKIFKLSSRSMKRLSIHNIGRPFKAAIDAPSIVSFHYEGILPRSISFTTTSSDDHLWKSEIKLRPSSNDFYPLHRFDELYSLLKALSQSEVSLELDQIEIRRLRSQLEIEVGFTDEEAKHELPVVVDHLRLKRSAGRNMRSAAALFLTRLFLMFRPRFIYLSRGMLTIECYRKIGEILFQEKETVPSYFWQRVLEGVGLQVKCRNQSEWQLVEHTSFAEVSKKGADGKLELRIQLKWSD